MISELSLESDPSGKKFQRLIFGILLLAAFIFDQLILVAVVAFLMLFFIILPWRFSPIYQFRRLFSPPPPKMCECGSSETAFACGLGVLFLLAGLICHYFGMENLAWSLILLVAVLSLLAGTVGFCLGSFIFLWLKRKLCDVA